MNDRIKYRYWKNKDWHNPNSELEPVYCNIVDGCDPTIAVSDFEFCTGLKDKNGKLIYEGDIVKYHYDWEDEIKPVFFDTISVCYGVKICKDFILPFTNGLDNIEVIGNIHENPELLED